jgi:DNA invertase Pin-like site-specific DNA recombinase
MFTESHRKVSAEHLHRDAFLYVRQSTARQILENAESTKRQYALRDRAVALGWPIERVHIIDHDQGRSGARAESRDGFEKLVSEVVLGRAGILLGLEVSRLARNDADWQRLLELCALYSCLVGDEDGVYDPTDFNDRLLMGLKGTISSAELHMLTERLVGGQRNKARRGALEVPLPIGLVYNAAGAVTLDPDPRIQASVRLIFDTFRQARSAHAVQDRFRREGLKFPCRIRGGAGKGRVIFGPIDAARIAQILHNPRYAGAFVYGRSRVVKKPNFFKRVLTSTREHWQVLIKNAHPGYISWDEFESNEQTLQNNLTEFHRGRPPQGIRKQEGLLQGRVLCGVCGTRMQVRSEWRDGQRIHYYTCQESPGARRRPSCRWIAAPEIDAAVGRLLLQTLSSTAIHSALSVQAELARRLAKTHTQQRRALERLRLHAETQRRRFVNCDPDRRLVADALEKDWNEALRQLDALQQEQGQQRQADPMRLDEESRTRVTHLTQDFPLAWNDPGTPLHERTHMLALLIEDVTLIQGDPITVHVRFRGGRNASLTVPRPPPPRRASKVLPEVIKELDHLLEICSDSQAAVCLNALGYRSWLGHPFTTNRVVTLRQRAGLKSQYERLRAQGFLTAQEMARELGLCFGHTLRLAHAGVLPTQRCGKAQRVLFAPLNGAVFIRGHGGYNASTPPRLIPAAQSSQVTKTVRR